MSNIKELIREKIDAFYTEYKAKFHQNGDSYHLGIIDGLDMAERILGTLPDESEQPTRGYDEAYLNEKIAKASKSWEGVDVDKFMDEVRGREPITSCNKLEGKKTFDDYLKASPSERRKMNMAEILGEEREMKIWHEMAKEYPPIGETVCILWNDGIITTDVWDEEDSISPWMKYWCLSSDICLPKE